MFVEMLKAAAFIFISGVFCGVYAQSKEAKFVDRKSVV